MARLRAAQLLHLMETHGAQAIQRHVAEAVAEGKMSLSDFSIRDLALTFLGESWNDRFKAISIGQPMPLREAGDPVKSTIFSNITGQLIFSEIRKQFALEQFIFSQKIPVIKTVIAGTETVPSITDIGDTAEVVGEGQEYGSVGVGEEYFTIPAKVKMGHKIDVTEEAIFFDRTNLLVEAAGKIGQFLAFRKERDLIDVFTGHVNNYDRNGTATNTYLTAGAFVNNQTGVLLNDWTDIEAAELLFVDILNPNTSLPIDQIDPGQRQLVVMPHKIHTARQILNATEIRSTRGTNIETVSASTVPGYDLMTSTLLYRRVLDTIEATASIAREVFWLGSMQNAFAWYENWPLAVFRQGGDGPAAFDRDISMRFKARYRGVAAVREPRWMTRNEDVAV